MGNSWQTAEQKAFITEHLASYSRHSEEGTLKSAFWPKLFGKWFEIWPIPDAPPEVADKEGGAQKAKKAERAKKTAQIKRVFKTISNDTGVGGRRELNLEVGCRRWSEIQAYMSLYYDTRIRETVVKEWDEANITNMGFSGSSPEVPENQVDPEDSHLFKDRKIPLCFKRNVAQRLYEAEEEEIKDAVRSKREEKLLIKTVYNVNEEERLELIQEYQKNVSSLKRNMTNILQNAERKCAAKGIFWLASPSPQLGGKPAAHFYSAGQTPDHQDFEAFIGPQKAEEFKHLFSRWIHTIYPPSDWALFSHDGPVQPAPTVAEDIATVLFGTTSPVSEPSATSKPSTSSLNSATSTESPVPGFPPPSLTPAPSGPPPALEVSSPLNHTNGARQPDTTQLTTTSDTLDHTHEPDHGDGDAIMDFVESYSTNELQLPASVDAHPQRNVGPSDLSLERGMTQNAGHILPPGPLANITNEPVWMKKKRTLDFFRRTPKLGCLSDVIQHWYELEELLGFQDATPQGFPVSERPPVIRVFHKYAHNYRKNYGVEVHTLGRQIMSWWSELCPPGEPPKVRFGGPIGISTLTILLSWWCAELVTRPDGEHADCLRTLADVDRVLLEVINDIKRGPTTSNPTPSPPAPTPQSPEQADSTTMPPRKRKRSAKH